MNKTNPPPEDDIVPFGKYRDQPVERLLADPDYLQWVIGQPGLMAMLEKRHPSVFNIITIGSPAPQDSPEHNRLQARFLDTSFQHAFIELRAGKSVHAVSMELAAQVNARLAKYDFNAFVALAAADCQKAEKLLLQAKEEHARLAAEDSRSHYLAEQQEHGKRVAERKRTRDERNVYDFSLRSEFPSYDKWLQDYRTWGTWPSKVHEQQEKADSAAKDFQKSKEAYQRLVDSRPKPGAPERPKITTDFECGYDLSLRISWSSQVYVWRPGDTNNYARFYTREWLRDYIEADKDLKFAIELKPQVGDDFPSVLRQMKRNGADTLVVGAFESTSCSLEQVRKMFGDRQIITVGEIEAAQRRGATKESVP